MTERFFVDVCLSVLGVGDACRRHAEKVGFWPVTLVVSPANLERAFEVRDALGMKELRVQVIYGIPSEMWFVASPKYTVFGSYGV